MPVAIRAAQNDGTATDAAVAQVGETAAGFSHKGTLARDIVTFTIEALIVIVRSPFDTAQELFDDIVAELQKLTGLTVDDDHRNGLEIGDPAAWV